MVREYCDKCKKEIPHEDGEKKVVEISYPTRGYAGYNNIHTAKVTLCSDCFSEMKIAERVKDIGANSKEEKEKGMVERFLEVFKELVTECLEES